MLEINNFWRKTSYNIGGYIFSLDDMEHGILRGTNFCLFYACDTVAMIIMMMIVMIVLEQPSGTAETILKW